MIKDKYLFWWEFFFRLKIVFEQNLPVAQIHVGILGRPTPSTIFHGG